MATPGAQCENDPSSKPLAPFRIVCLQVHENKIGSPKVMTMATKRTISPGRTGLSVETVPVCNNVFILFAVVVNARAMVAIRGARVVEVVRSTVVVEGFTSVLVDSGVVVTFAAVVVALPIVVDVVGVVSGSLVVDADGNKRFVVVENANPQQLTSKR
eukprot:Stramenopile-MAST_4_protein_5584